MYSLQSQNTAQNLLKSITFINVFKRFQRKYFLRSKFSSINDTLLILDVKPYLYTLLNFKKILFAL